MHRLSTITTEANIRQLIFRLTSIVLGGVFLTAGVVKGLDIHAFMNQIDQYGLLPQDTGMTGSLAWILVVAEIVLGASLIVNWRPKSILSAVMAMLLIFVGALVWAIIKGGVDDCGCFGPAAQRSPTQALFEDIILLLAAFAAWRLSNERIHSRHPIKMWIVALACAMGLALPMATGSLPWKAPAPPSISATLPEGLLLRSPLGEVVDFQAGTTLLAVMSTDCHHCRESVPLLNELVAAVGETIQVYGVAANEKAEIDRFVEENFTFYPVIPVDEESLTMLLGDDPFPKFVLVRRGTIIGQWSSQLPSLQALIDLSANAKGA